MYIFAPSNKETMETRTAILQKNFYAICRQGFQATRTDKVIGELGITKGAFYHYFPDKLSMGYAIVEEIIRPMYVSHWHKTQNSNLPALDAIAEALQNIGKTATEENIGMGCPLNNLVQEMSTIDETFRLKLADIINMNIGIITEILEKGIAKQEVLPTVNAPALACFIWASLEGCFGLGKVLNSLPAFQASLQTLIIGLQAYKYTG